MQRFPQHLPVMDKSAGLGCVVGCNSMGVFPLLSSHHVLLGCHCRQTEGSGQFGSAPLWPVNRELPDQTGFLNRLLLHQFCSKPQQQQITWIQRGAAHPVPGPSKPTPSTPRGRGDSANSFPSLWNCLQCGCKATHLTSHSDNCVQCVIYSFFLIFFSPFPCGVWLFQEAVPWFGPLSAGSTMVAGESKGWNKGWWCPGNGEIQQQHCPTPSGVGLAPLDTALPCNHGSCNKGLVLLLFGLWGSCLGWALPKVGLLLKVPQITPCRTFTGFFWPCLQQCCNFTPCHPSSSLFTWYEFFWGQQWHFVPPSVSTHPVKVPLNEMCLSEIHSCCRDPQELIAKGLHSHWTLRTWKCS